MNAYHLPLGELAEFFESGNIPSSSVAGRPYLFKEVVCYAVA